MTYYVPMTQPLRGLIPLLLDGAAAEPMIAGERVACRPQAHVSPQSLSATAPEGSRTSATLTVENRQQDEGHTLHWEITEAKSDCSKPSELGWVSAAPARGYTAPAGSSPVNVTFDTAGLTAPATPNGLLCLKSDDGNSPTIGVPISLRVAYRFTGFLSPTVNPPGVNAASAGSSTPLKFKLGGDRGLNILAAGSPTSQQVDCGSLATLGTAQPTESGSKKGVQFDRKTGDYQYVWKTSSLWLGTCRVFTLTLNDGSQHPAYYSFR
jgi:hypothetical protein